MSDCGLCGLPMPEDEDMFMYHGFSGPCPGPQKPRVAQSVVVPANILRGLKLLIATCVPLTDEERAAQAWIEAVSAWAESA